MRLLLGASCLALAAISVSAQQPSPETPGGKVIYQRSTNEKAATPANKSGSDSTVKSEVTDADRAALTFTRYALDVRLQPEAPASQPALSVRAQLTVRNDGTRALSQIPLQLTSTLNWEEVRVVEAGRLTRCRFLDTPLDSDADHTGKLNEAAIVLPHPLATGTTLSLDVIYSGQAPVSTQRLQGIGTPADIAQHSDWDEVAPDFVGLRGFGNVAWYPVASVPVRLGDGDKLFAEIGRIKLRQAEAVVSLKVTEESRSSVPDVAILNGTVVPLTVAPGTEQANVPSLVSCSLPAAPLGFQTMSLFLAKRHRQTGSGTDVYTRPEDAGAAAPYLSAASIVTPLVRTWLGAQAPGNQPKSPLSILDLPAAEDAPFEERQALYTALQPLPADQLTGTLSHALAHAYFLSPRPWLNEGVAQFVSTLWTEQSKSRPAAIEQLNAQRGALALAEPDDEAGTASDRPNLLHTSDAIDYRTKATYVLWMLREMVGDDALQSVLKTYDPAADTTDTYFEELVLRFAKTGTPGATGPKGSADPGADMGKDLHQLFDDWVYHDRGLPDLAITGVYTSKASAPNSYLVAVNLTNSGSAFASVPVTVTSGTTQVTERMSIPAHGTAVRRILIQDAPVQVQVNDGVVPETEASEHVQRIHYSQAATP